MSDRVRQTCPKCGLLMGTRRDLPGFSLGTPVRGRFSRWCWRFVGLDCPVRPRTSPVKS